MWSYGIGILRERFKTSRRDKSYDKLICFCNICQLGKSGYKTQVGC